MKTEFELQAFMGGAWIDSGFKIEIIGNRPEHKPYISIEFGASSSQTHIMKDKDTERFAVNILKALKSKRLKQ